jgi:Fe-S-cluster containining protein
LKTTLTSGFLNQILERHSDTFCQLAALYDQMDAAYSTIAQNYGFLCMGCEDNCCRTRFYHHTVLEAAGLWTGYRELPELLRASSLERAHTYFRALEARKGHDRPLRILCPLNVDERCLLYRQRPMICRLHGIPHTMQHPTRGLITGTGCHMFEGSHSRADGHPLDRTPLYAAMAMLEKSLRRAAGFESAVRLTIAEMILVFEDRDAAG